MIIKPSAMIRNNYNEVADLCRQTGEPVYLTRNGEGDLVVCDIDAFSKRESELKQKEHDLYVAEKKLWLKKELQRVDDWRKAGHPDIPIEEAMARLDKYVDQLRKEKTNSAREA